MTAHFSQDGRSYRSTSGTGKSHRSMNRTSPSIDANGLAWCDRERLTCSDEFRDTRQFGVLCLAEAEGRRRNVLLQVFD